MMHSDLPLKSGYIAPVQAIVGGMVFSRSSSDYGFFSSKIYEKFQYTNKIAGIGYPKVIYRAFTGSELLLERAEAEIMLGRYDAAANDLMAYWNDGLNSSQQPIRPLISLPATAVTSLRLLFSAIMVERVLTIQLSSRTGLALRLWVLTSPQQLCLI